MVIVDNPDKQQGNLLQISPGTLQSHIASQTEGSPKCVCFHCSWRLQAKVPVKD
jgi:hypothetical protein